MTSLRSDLTEFIKELEFADALASDGFPYRWALRKLTEYNLTPERVDRELRSAYLEGTGDGGNEWANPAGPSNA